MDPIRTSAEQRTTRGGIRGLGRWCPRTIVRWYAGGHHVKDLPVPPPTSEMIYRLMCSG